MNNKPDKDFVDEIIVFSLDSKEILIYNLDTKKYRQFKEFSYAGEQTHEHDKDTLKQLGVRYFNHTVVENFEKDLESEKQLRKENVGSLETAWEKITELENKLSFANFLLFLEKRNK